MRKVCVVVTARPSYARIKTVLKEIQAHPDLELQLVVAASALLERYGPVVDIIRADGFEPEEIVYMVLEGENLVTAAKSTGLGVLELATAFDNLKPDVVVSVADRYETIATAIAASYLNIPVAHVQGGEVTGSIDEKVRHAVTKLSNLHFVSNEAAADRVIKMGETEESVFVTGCPSIDLTLGVRDSGDFPAQETVFSGVGTPFDLSEPYVVVMQHPVTTEVERSFEQVQETLESVAQLEMNALWFWPNVDAGSDSVSKGIRVFRERSVAERIYFIKNLTPEDFLAVVSRSVCMIGNSSAGIRECSCLGVPVVNIGSRQAGRDRGKNVIDVPNERSSILKAVRDQIEHGKYPYDSLYGDGTSGERIADILATEELLFDKKITY